MNDDEYRVLDAAVAAYNAGLCPIRPRINGTKAPLPVPGCGKIVDETTGRRKPGWELFQLERPTRQTVAKWFENYPGLGIVCGEVSRHLQMFECEGRMMTDPDRRQRFSGALDEHGARGTWDRMTAGYLEITPGDGVHTFAHVPGYVAGNVVLARTMTDDGPRPLIETRADGGFVVVAPSNGAVHETGRPWRLHTGEFASIVTITVDEWNALCAAALECNEVASDEPTVPAAKRLTVPEPWTGGAVGDSWIDVTVEHLEATGGVLAVLLRHGWTRWRDTPEMIYVTRPGDDKQGGVSAQIKKANGRMINYSSSVPEFETWPTFRGDPPRKVPTTSYDAADVLAVYEFDGDRDAALRAVAAEAGIYDAWLAERDPLHGITIGASDHDDDDEAGASDDDDAEPSEPSLLAIAPLPEAFWAPEYLARIRREAQSRFVTPEAALAALLVEALGHVEPSVVLPPTIGTNASLNLYVNEIAPSGLGKSSSAGAARDLLRVPKLYFGLFPTRRQLGSGQGLVESYLVKVGKVKIQETRSVLFTMDEGAALHALASQRESTMLATVRAGWNGHELGAANASEDSRRHLNAHSYRLGLVVNFTPAAAAELLRGVEYGTPQRFLWISAQPRGLTHPTGNIRSAIEWTPPPTPPKGKRQEIFLPSSAQIEIIDEHIARCNGKPFDPYDSHANLMRLKVATGLALLDDSRAHRYRVTVADWQRAGFVMEHSNATRGALLKLLSEKYRKAERARRRSLAEDRVAETAAVDRYTADACARRIAELVWSDAGEWTARRVRQRMPRYRRVFEEGVDEAKRKGWIVERVEAGQGDGKRRLERGRKRP